MQQQQEPVDGLEERRRLASGEVKYVEFDLRSVGIKPKTRAGWHHSEGRTLRVRRKQWSLIPDSELPSSHAALALTPPLAYLARTVAELEDAMRSGGDVESVWNDWTLLQVGVQPSHALRASVAFTTLQTKNTPASCAALCRGSRSYTHGSDSLLLIVPPTATLSRPTLHLNCLPAGLSMSIIPSTLSRIVSVCHTLNSIISTLKGE